MNPKSQQKRMTQKMLIKQEGLRKEIESNMANLSTCHNQMTKILEEEGYHNLSDNDFKVELYDQRTVVAMTDPTLLDNDYVTRMNLMDQINSRLAQKLQRKKEKLAMLERKERKKESSTEPRRSDRLRGRKSRRSDEYYYYN